MQDVRLTIMDTKAFGERFRMVREAQKLSQAAVAKACGKSRGAISQWESGLVKDVDARALKLAAKKMRVSVDYLLDGEDPPKPLDLPAAILAHWAYLTETQRLEIAEEVRKKAELNRAILDELTGQ
jgi:transcriptional regulator with XRE-family HTH domain